MFLKGFLGFVSVIFGLFLYQNSTRGIEVDQAGNALSLDLFVWGIAAPNHLSVSLLISIVFIIGLLCGLLISRLRDTSIHNDGYE